MEKVSSFTYCNKIQLMNNPDGQPSKSLIGAFTELFLPFFPTHYSFAMSFTISGIKPNPDNYLRVTFEDPNGKMLEELKIEHCTPPEESLQPNKTEYSVMIDAELQNVLLQQPGPYTTHISFNGKELNDYTLDITLQEKRDNQ